MKKVIYLGLVLIFTFISVTVNGQELKRKKDSNEKWGFVNESGEWIIQPQYDDIDFSFREGLVAVKLNDKWGFIDESGKWVIQPQYDATDFFNEGLARVKLNDQYGFIDKSGTIIIKPQYEGVSFFSEGLARVKLNDQYGFIDKSGTIIIKPQYDDAGFFSEGLVRVKLIGKWGYVDKSGAFVIKPQYEGTYNFRKGLASVKLNNKWGAIDIANNTIIPITHENYSFSSEKLTKAQNTTAQKSTTGEYDEIRHEIAVRTGHSLFSYYAISYVHQRINKWQKKGEFEPTSAWKQRVTEESRRQKANELTKEAEKEYITLRSSELNSLDSIFTLGAYDADSLWFLLENRRFGKLLVSVPLDKAPSFKADWKKYKVDPRYFIENDQLGIAGVTFTSNTNPPTEFKSKKLEGSGYLIVDIDYNFDPIELYLPTMGSKETRNISRKTITVGKSDVDMNIPVTKAVNKNTFAVIISNENYKMVDPVAMSLNDGEIFSKYCHKTLGLPKSNIKFYKDATFGELLAALENVKDISEAYDGKIDILFYYSGHGFPNEKTRDAYLLPIDGSSSQMETSYPLSRLYSELSSTKAQHITVFLDACFSGSQRDGSMLASARGIAIKPRMGIPTENMVVFSAASGNETAYPYSTKNHGLFTYFLLKKLKESKGNVTLKELGDYISKNVRQRSAVDNNKPQTPTVNRASTRYLVP